MWHLQTFYLAHHYNQNITYKDCESVIITSFVLDQTILDTNYYFFVMQTITNGNEKVWLIILVKPPTWRWAWILGAFHLFSFNNPFQSTLWTVKVLFHVSKNLINRYYLHAWGFSLKIWSWICWKMCWFILSWVLWGFIRSYNMCTLRRKHEIKREYIEYSRL